MRKPEKHEKTQGRTIKIFTAKLRSRREVREEGLNFALLRFFLRDLRVKTFPLKV
jgi:hypothetical protein